jgi:hypothetical protein
LINEFNFFESFYLSYIAEIGQLHSLIGVSNFSGNLMDGGSWSNIFWPFNVWLGIGARSGGVFVVETLLDDFSSGRKWGFHATLLGDAYLGFGFFGVVLFSMFVGFIIAKFSRDYVDLKIQLPFIVLIFIQILRLIFESMDKLPEIYITVIMYIFVSRFSLRKKSWHIGS